MFTRNKQLVVFVNSSMLVMMKPIPRR